jgi:hypothetical protein
MSKIDDPSGYDSRDKVCPPPLDYTKQKALAKQIAADLRATLNDWPASDAIPTIDPETAE